MSTREWGLFSDEGCVEAGFWSEAEAVRVYGSSRYRDEDCLTVREMCSDHEGQARETCEECPGDDEED